MSGLDPGKLPTPLLRGLLAAAAAEASEVVLGPAPGEDACAIALGGGVLVAATDPITLTGSEVGAHAVVINANDVAVMGVRPRWFLATVLLPPGSSAGDVDALFAGMRGALDSVGAVLVGGHTEVTAAVRQPVVVGQMLGFAPDGQFVRTGGLRPGDAVVQVGPAPVEGAAVLAAECTDRLGELPASLRRRAATASSDPGLSVVDSALCAAAAGATALHDPTEGGLATGLAELALASALRVEVDRAAVLWFEPGVAVCRALGADPWGTLASGALLAGFPEGTAEAACGRLAEQGFEARRIGRALEGQGVVDTGGEPLPDFSRDEVARILG